MFGVYWVPGRNFLTKAVRWEITLAGMAEVTSVAIEEHSDQLRRRHRVGIGALSFLSAAWCGLSLVMAGAAMVVVSGTQLYKTLIATGDDASVHLGELWGIILFGAFVALVLGVAFGRYLLRVLPPRPWDQGFRRRVSALAAVPLCIAYFCFFYIAVILVALVETSDSGPQNDVAKIAPYLASSVPFALLWAGGVVGPLILRHRKPRAFLGRPFILFLRRFSTFSDRAVIAMVLRQAAPGVPVVFLTPTSSRPRDWDLFIVGFAGLKLLHPWLSMPIVLRARDDDWQRTANELIQRAHVILLDASETSGSLRTEVELIENAKRWSDTVLLRKLPLDASPWMDLSGSTTGIRIVDYKKSWVRALPRIVLGFVVVQLPSTLVSLSLVLISSGLVTLVLNIMVLVMGASVYLRPTINREATTALRTVFRAAHGTPAKV